MGFFQVFGMCTLVAVSATLKGAPKAEDTNGVRGMVAGSMTMWSSSPDTIVGSSCEYANARLGGRHAPSAVSPYVRRSVYCAVNAEMYRAGMACGECYRISYSGAKATDPGRPGSTIIQVVDSGAWATFDCHLSAFNEITGAHTGIFPIAYEKVPCEMDAVGPVATVFDHSNAWYTKFVFSNLRQSVASAELVVGSSRTKMSRVGGAVFSSWLTAGTRGRTSFIITTTSGESIRMDDCFEDFPKANGAMCTMAMVQGRTNKLLAASAPGNATEPTSATNMNMVDEGPTVGAAGNAAAVTAEELNATATEPLVAAAVEEPVPADKELSATAAAAELLPADKELTQELNATASEPLAAAADEEPLPAAQVAASADPAPPAAGQTTESAPAKEPAAAATPKLRGSVQAGSAENTKEEPVAPEIFP